MKYCAVFFALGDGIDVLPDAEITTRFVGKDGNLYHGTLFFPIDVCRDKSQVFEKTKDFVKTLERLEQAAKEQNSEKEGEAK